MARIEIRLTRTGLNNLSEVLSVWLIDDILAFSGELMHELEDERDDWSFNLGKTGFLLVMSIRKAWVISLRIDGKVVFVNTNKTG